MRSTPAKLPSIKVVISEREVDRARKRGGQHGEVFLQPCGIRNISRDEKGVRFLRRNGIQEFIEQVPVQEVEMRVADPNDLHGSGLF